MSKKERRPVAVGDIYRENDPRKVREVKVVSKKGRHAICEPTTRMSGQPRQTKVLIEPLQSRWTFISAAGSAPAFPVPSMP